MVKKGDSSGKSSKSARSKKSKLNKNMGRTLNRIKERNKTKQTSRENDKSYLEYRKQQVLGSPQKAVAGLREGDEAYPKRRRSMDSIERKADYQGTDSSHGRKQTESKSKAITAKYTDHSGYEIKIEDPVLNNDRYEAMPVVATSPSARQLRKEERRGNRAENPLAPNGQPFWVADSINETDEVTDDDLPINTEILERICNGDLSLAAKPFTKTKFNPFGSVKRFKFDDALFQHDTTLFTSTIEAVILTQIDDDAVYPTYPPIENKIKWSDKIRVATYDSANRDLSDLTLKIEDMKDVKRENAEKKTC